MAGYAGKNEFQRGLSKLYGQLCYRFTRHEVWQDAMWMFACAISNAVDYRFAKEREAQYMRIVQKYDEKERQVFPQLFCQIVNGMEAYPDCDFLGELYMELELGNKHGGQFFTPYGLCQAMARVNIKRQHIDDEMARQGYVSINDCACGAGALLVAAANYLHEIGFDYQRNALFVAQDIDSTTALMCYIQLSMLGCAGYVIIGDTLAAPQTGPVLFGEGNSRCWYTPMYFENTWTIRRLAAVEKQRWRTALEATGLKAEKPEGSRLPESATPTDEPAAKREEPPVSIPSMPPIEADEQPQNAPVARKRRKKTLEGQISLLSEEVIT